MTGALSFADRHIGPGPKDIRAMLATLGVTSVDTLISQAVPKSIRLDRELDLPAAASEAEALAELQALMGRNEVKKSFIGAGYHGCHVPPVIQRNLFENPAWYTAYTPYQSEISQGRLEMLFHFQTLVAELTGLPIASASLLDEATAVAEAIAIAHRHHRDTRDRIALAGTLHPQVLDVVQTRAEPIGMIIEEGEADEETAALVVPWPDTFGVYRDHAGAIAKAKEHGALVVFVADPLALAITATPASLGADIAVGSMQRFGVPMGFGGPHAAYCAVSERLMRLMPGRIVGQSTDARGRPAFRLALQTREQHIRRDKATSNICTAQALLANMAAAYSIWHGPDGLQSIAERVHRLASRFADALRGSGNAISGDRFFDTVTVEATGDVDRIVKAAEDGGRLLRMIDGDRVGVTFDETSTEEDLAALASLFGASLSADAPSRLPGRRPSEGFMTQPVFHENRSETEMMRFLRRLADRDLALDRAMIPLGSCTMKLNAAAEMMPVSWPEVAELHPFAPAVHTAGYHGDGRSARSVARRDHWLRRGFAAAERRQPGRICRPAGDPRMAPLARRHRPRRLPDPVVRARHEPGKRRDGRHADRGGQMHGSRRHRRRRSARQGLGQCRTSGGADDHLPLHPRRFRGGRARYLQARSRVRWAGLSRRGQSQRPGRAGKAGRSRRRRVPHEPAQDFLHSTWRWRARRRTDRGQGTSGAIPARQCSGRHRSRGRRAHRSAAPRSCRSPGCISA